MKQSVKVLKARSTRDETDILTAAREILNIFRTDNISRFLIHAQDDQCHSTNSQMYFFANEGLRNMAFDVRIRVGMLVSPGDRSRDFLQLVCHNAGYQLRVFRQEKEAMSWLSQDISVN